MSGSSREGAEEANIAVVDLGGDGERTLNVAFNSPAIEGVFTTDLRWRKEYGGLSERSEHLERPLARSLEIARTLSGDTDRQAVLGGPLAGRAPPLILQQDIRGAEIRIRHGRGRPADDPPTPRW